MFSNCKSEKLKAFTLIELLVVIAIIGLLSSVVFASLNSARAKARDAQRLSDIRQIALALELYRDDNGSYPVRPNWMGTTPGCFANNNLPDPNDAIPGLVPTYMPSLPRDPKPVFPSYCYLYISNGTDFKLLIFNTIETINMDSHPLDDPIRGPATGAIYTPGARNW